MDSIILLDMQGLYQLLWQLGNTLLLFFVLSKLLFKPIQEFMANRTARIEEEVKLANDKKEEALSLKKEYEEKLDNIKVEADSIFREARKNASDREEQIIKEAKQEAEQIKNRAKKDIEREQEKVKDEVKQNMVDIASMMASKFVASSLDQKEKEKMLDEAIDDLGDVKWLS